MIAMIETLIQNGRLILPQTATFTTPCANLPLYGQLSGKSLDDLRAGERVEVDGFKRDPLDFVLWKAAKKQANLHGKARGATAVRAGTSNALP